MKRLLNETEYDAIMARVDELVEMVDDSTPHTDKMYIELDLLTDLVVAYEKEHFPVGKPTISKLIELSLEEKGITQRELAKNIGVSPSRICDYIAGRAEPTLKIARQLCLFLGIPPAAMMQL